MSRSLPFVVAALALPALGAAAADAAELTYVDNHNVYVENVDGSQRHALSADGTAARPYTLPTADRFGNLAAFQLSADGTQQQIVFWTGGAGTPVRHRMERAPGDTSAQPPTSARMQPDALPDREQITLGYTFNVGGDPAEPRYGRVNPLSGSGSAFASARWSDLTWHRERPLVAEDGVLYWTGRTQPLADARGEGYDITFGELSADGARWLIRMRDIATGAVTLDLFSYTGQIGSGTIGDGCHIPVSAGFQRGALSRDGKSVAWEDGAGVHIAQADPTKYDPATELCALTGKRTVSSTARMPSFSDATTTAPPGPPAPNPPGGGGGGQSQAGTQAKTQTRTQTRPDPRVPDGGGKSTARTFTVTVPQSVRAGGLRRGVRLTSAVPGAGKVTLTLRRAKKAIASGTATATRAGTVKVKLRVRKGAGKISGKARLTSTFRPKDGGPKITRTATVKVG